MGITARDSVPKQDVKKAELRTCVYATALTSCSEQQPPDVSYRCIRNGAHNSFRIHGFQRNGESYSDKYRASTTEKFYFAVCYFNTLQIVG
jgi:hypothetical protein